MQSGSAPPPDQERVEPITVMSGWLAWLDNMLRTRYEQWASEARASETWLLFSQGDLLPPRYRPHFVGDMRYEWEEYFVRTIVKFAKAVGCTQWIKKHDGFWLSAMLPDTDFLSQALVGEPADDDAGHEPTVEYEPDEPILMLNVRRGREVPERAAQGPTPDMYAWRDHLDQLLSARYQKALCESKTMDLTRGEILPARWREQAKAGLEEWAAVAVSRFDAIQRYAPAQAYEAPDAGRRQHVCPVSQEYLARIIAETTDENADQVALSFILRK